MSRKRDFAEAARRLITSFDALAGCLKELDDIYHNSGYEPTGSDPITNTELDGLDMTTQDLSNVSVFVANLQSFLHGNDPLVFDYSAKIDAFRTMP